MLSLTLHPNSILRKRAEEVGTITPEIKELVLAMIETMKENKGVGLAAPQVGVSKRIIIVKTENGPAAFVNPRIFKKSRTVEADEEGCLSVPGIFLKIKRIKKVEIEALDFDGRKIQIKAEGFLARIFQHELDHLNGVLIIDRINFWQKIKFALKI